MKLVLSEEGLVALHATLKRQPLLAFDFDGTLAPIVARPQDAAVSPAVASQLQRLRDRFPIAVISGRRVADLHNRLGFDPHFVVGNHGAEDPSLPAQDDLALALDPLRQRLQHSAHTLLQAGVLVEDKHYSIALHYRLATDQKQALDMIQEVLAPLVQVPALTEESLHIFGGKKVVNAVAARAPKKADAIKRLTRQIQAKALVFVGDDINDEPVFERNEPDWLTVKVGLDEAPTKALFLLHSVHDMGRLLNAIQAFTTLRI